DLVVVSDGTSVRRAGKVARDLLDRCPWWSTVVPGYAWSHGPGTDRSLGCDDGRASTQLRQCGVRLGGSQMRTRMQPPGATQVTQGVRDAPHVGMTSQRSRH